MRRHVRETHFSTTYTQARHRFRHAAEAAGAAVHSYPVNVRDRDDLTVDVAVIGPDTAPAVVTSSAVHGIEGFFGSAVQLGLLDQLRQPPVEPRVRHVLIHGVNPYGFDRLRRFNEENVDLNRNFLRNGAAFNGASDGYAHLNKFLNPESPPSRMDLFRLRAVWHICRHGLQPLKQAVAGGQYDYPKGIFFGGHRPSQSAQIVFEHCDAWIGKSEPVAHIDFHTGLGPFGTYKLLLEEEADEAAHAWYTETFGPEHVEPADDPHATAYPVTGVFGAWLQDHFSDRTYRFVAAEFGTYSIIRVLEAVRSENRAHHFGAKESAIYQSAKAELLECFCPKDKRWRRQAVASGLNIIRQAETALAITGDAEPKTLPEIH